ncbi:YuiA family protein [Peribacillus sp. SCS-37]
MKRNQTDCSYCSGNGYFQLLLGGTETCACCNGSGKEKKEAC